MRGLTVRTFASRFFDDRLDALALEVQRRGLLLIVAVTVVDGHGACLDVVQDLRHDEARARRRRPSGSPLLPDILDEDASQELDRLFDSFLGKESLPRVRVPRHDRS